MRAAVAATVISALLATSRIAAAAPGDRWDGPTVGTVAEGEAIGMLVGGGIGAGVGIGLSYASDSRSGIAILLTMVIGMSIGSVAGMTVGAKLGGDHANGTGGWIGTSLGEVGALAATTGMVMLARKEPAFAKPAMLLSLAVLFAGPIIGYELSSDRTAPRQVAIGGTLFRF